MPFTNLAIEVAWRLDDVVGYVRTWSAVKAAQKVVGAHVIEQFEQALREAWGDAETRRRVRWPLALRVGRVPPRR